MCVCVCVCAVFVFPLDDMCVIVVVFLWMKSKIPLTFLVMKCVIGLVISLDGI